MAGSEPQSLVLFDGECGMCRKSVQFIIRHDPAARFLFASRQSPEAVRRIEAAGAHLPDLPDSILLIERGVLHTRSDAVLRIARKLQFPWNLGFTGIVVPRPVRDAVYNWVARNRRRFQSSSCPLATPETRTRFL